MKDKETQIRLATALAKIGWSQSEFARRIDVTQTTTSNMLRGRIHVATEIVRYAERIAEIIEGQDPPRGNLMPARRHAEVRVSRMRQALDRLTAQGDEGPACAE